VEAATLRLHDPDADAWRIWWTATSRPGHLDPPMLGAFGPDGIGTFLGDDALAPDGTPVRLRFLWKPHEAAGPRWEQARSRHGGPWETGWTMDFTRAPA
jgi:hypothetical protein